MKWTLKHWVMAGLSFFTSLGLAAREDYFELPPSRELLDSASPHSDFGGTAASPASKYNYCRQPYRYDQSMLNTAHRYLSESACAQALWFDSFFGNETSISTVEHARSFIRVAHTESFRWEEDIDQNSTIRVRARVYLPTAENRFGVILSGESKDDASTLGDSENISGTASTREADNVTATFRWAEDVSDALGLDFDASARLDSGQPVGILSTKFKQLWNFSSASNIALHEEFFWRTDDEGYGNEFGAGFNLRLSQTWLYSIDSQLYHSEDSDGWEWEAATGFSNKWLPRTAVIYTFGINGQTKPNNITDNYGISVRFRRNLYDGWLFFEFQPRMDFPRDRDRNATPGVALRLEAHFGEK